MRRAWKKSSRLAEAAVAALLIASMASAGGPGEKPQRHNELTLAGLRPGTSKLPRTTTFEGFGKPVEESTASIWADACDGRILSVEINKDRLVQSVSVSSLGQRGAGPGCQPRDERHLRNELATGRGLKLGDSCRRATALYGNPESRTPFVHGSQRLELLFYSFDWAGGHVPQSMQVSCNRRSGQVVEITLAAASL